MQKKALVRIYLKPLIESSNEAILSIISNFFYQYFCAVASHLKEKVNEI